MLMAGVEAEEEDPGTYTVRLLLETMRAINLSAVNAGEVLHDYQGYHSDLLECCCVLDRGECETGCGRVSVEGCGSVNVGGLV